MAEDGGVLVFVEVKTRVARPGEDLPPFGAPEEAVTARKRRKLESLAQAYLRRVRPVPPCRFDVVSIVLPPAPRGALGRLRAALFPAARVVHIRGAFTL